MLTVKKVSLFFIFAILAAFTVASGLPLNAFAAAEDGLVMALEFDGVSDANTEMLTLADSSGKNNSAEMKNYKGKNETEFPTIKFTEGKFGNALRLNGAQQYIDVKPQIFNNEAVTIAFWVNYRGGANWQRFFEMGTAETGEHMMINPSTDTGKFQISGYNKKEQSAFTSNPTDSGFKFPQNVWTHVAWTMSADGTTAVYINGQVLSMTTIVEKNGAKQTVKNKTSFKSPVSFKYVATLTGLENPDWFAARFGCAATSTWDSMLLGSFDSVRVYGKALSPEQVKQLCESNTSQISAGNESAASQTGNTGAAISSTGAASSGSTSTSAVTSEAASESVSGEDVQSGAEQETPDSGSEKDASSKSASSSNNAAKSTQNSFPVWIPIVIIITAAAAGAGIILFIRLK